MPTYQGLACDYKLSRDRIGIGDGGGGGRRYVRVKVVKEIVIAKWTSYFCWRGMEERVAWG